MSWNNLPAWDKNRPIFFQIGMIVALSLANIAINHEQLRPDYSDLVFEDNYTSLLMTEINSHTEVPAPKQHKIINKVNTIIAHIIPTDQPVDEKVEIIQDVQHFKDISDFISESGNSEVDIKLPEKADPSVTPILTISEQMPYLVTCDDKASEEERRNCTQSSMLATIYRYLKYPIMARETGIEGTVILSFVIDKNGQMTHLEIVRDIGAGCGTAAVKVLKSLGEWVPGKHNKQAVHVKYTIPIKFKLEK